MGDENKLAVDEYDSKHGKPESAPQDRGASEEDKWGLKQNPVRETPMAGTGLKNVGG